jgi:hypothetical protein
MHKYYCKKCKKYHYRGKIYNEHSDYKKEESNKDNYLDIESNKKNLDTLRPIAKRQLRILLKKI